MGRYFKKFAIHSEYVEYAESEGYIKPNVSICVAEKDLHYNKAEIKAVKFSSPDSCRLSVKGTSLEGVETMDLAYNDDYYEYSLDGRSWYSFKDRGEIPFGEGVVIYVRGDYETGERPSLWCDGSSVTVSGNAMYLITYKEELTEFPENTHLTSFFYGWTCLSDASGLKLPVTTLTDMCYSYMFEGCTSLVNVPALPATVLASECYSYMFSACTSLVNAPSILPAMALANDCYNSMFYDCSSLVNAPELPATTLADNCYQYMFQDCVSLVSAPALPATELADYCYENMFYGCTSLVNAPTLPATTLAEGCYFCMFNECSSLVNAPTLPAMTLAKQCYFNIFQDCPSLNHIKMMATDISANGCLSDWVSRVSSNGTFECATGMSTVIPSGTSGIPSGWTVTEVNS